MSECVLSKKIRLARENSEANVWAEGDAQIVMRSAGEKDFVSLDGIEEKAKGREVLRGWKDAFYSLDAAAEEQSCPLEAAD